jgi:EAL domain-containing protein (putative c-di-GMP-specific phosphodiesterase class I)
MGKKDANARQIRMPPAMEWRALIEFCRWYRRQSQVWRDAMPFMWLKFSIGSVLDKSFISRAERCLKGSKFPADRLGFEIPAHEAAARVDDLSKVATSLEHLRCFIVLDNFSVQSDHMDLLRLPAVRMIKLAPEVGTAMRIDTWMRKRVAGVAQTTRALGIKMVVKRIASRSEALWYRDYGVEFVQSQALSPGEPINALADMGKPDSTSESTSR